MIETGTLRLSTMTLKPQQSLTEGSSCTKMRLSVDQQRFKGCHNVRRLPNMLNEKHSNASSKYISSTQNRNCFWGTDQLKHSSDGSNYYTQIPTNNNISEALDSQRWVRAVLHHCSRACGHSSEGDTSLLLCLQILFFRTGITKWFPLRWGHL